MSLPKLLSISIPVRHVLAALLSGILIGNICNCLILLPDCSSQPRRIDCDDGSGDHDLPFPRLLPHYFFYNTTSDMCQSFEGCAAEDNLFETIELCIATCDPFGNGDRMSLNWDDEFDCHQEVALQTGPFQIRSREVAQAISPDQSRLFGTANNSLPVDKNGWNELHFAAFAGNASAITELVATHGPNLVLSKTNDLEVPLHLVVKSNNYEAVELLLLIGSVANMKIIINARDKCGYTPLHFAAATGNVEIARLLRSNGASPLVQSSTGKLPLHFAKSYEIIDQLLLDPEDANSTAELVNIGDIYGRTPLFYAGLRHQDDEGKLLLLAHYLINLGADYFRRDNFGMTPLHFAVAKNDGDFTRHMIHLVPANLTCCGAGRTLPHVAARFNAVDAFRFLLQGIDEHFALDLSARDWQGQDPSCIAWSHHNAAMIRLLEPNSPTPSTSCYQAFVASVEGANPSAIQDAIVKQQVDVVEFLLSKGAIDDKNRVHALELTVMQCNPANQDIILLLLSVTNDSSPNALQSSLEIAVRNYCPSMVQILLSRYSANCARFNEHGLTALHVAKQLGYDSLIETMVATGKCFLEQTDACGNTVHEVGANQILVCEDPPIIKHGRLDVTSRCVATKSVIICDAGFKVVGENGVYCRGDGKWQVDGYCKESPSCGGFPQIDNGILSSNVTDGDGNAIIICNKGFRLIGSGMVKCQKSETWQVGGFCQEELQCGPIPVIPNGIVSDGPSDVGSVRYLSCKTGYRLEGSNAVHCGEQKQWKVGGLCRDEQLCGDIPVIDSGVIFSHEDSYYGSTGKLTCNQGYHLEGSNEIRCNHVGKWHIAGSCFPDECGEAPSVVNGIVSDGSSVVGAKRILSCLKGYSLQGSSVVQCDENRRWLVNGFCTLEPCGQVPNLDNGKISPGSSEVNATRIASCNPGYGLTGSQIVRCGSNGHWMIDTFCTEVRHVPELGLAAQIGDVHRIGHLIEGGADVDSSLYAEKCTPIIIAAQHGHVDAVYLFIDRGADVNAKDVNGSTALAWAARSNRSEIVRLLVELGGADVNARNTFNTTALHWAARNGLVDAVRLLIERGAIVDARNNHLATPLILAANFNQTMVVEILVELGEADVNAENDNGDTPLHWAVSNGLPSAARFLIERGANVDAEDKFGWTPLKLAERNNLPQLKSLLTPSAWYMCGELPIVINGFISTGHSHVNSTRKLKCNSGYVVQGSDAVLCNEHGRWDVQGQCMKVKLCEGIPAVENGFVTIVTDKVHATASCNPGYGLVGSESLHCGPDGLWRINTSCVKVNNADELLAAIESVDLPKTYHLLAQLDFDVNAKSGGTTALIKAAQAGRTDIILLLMQRGAHIDAFDNSQNTAIIVASHHGQTEAVRMLLEQGANVNVINAEGDNALILASRTGYASIVALLIEAGADVNVKGSAGFTALTLACRYHHQGVARLLIEAGANVNAKGAKDGSTALMFAARYGQLETVRLLIDQGADVNSQTTNGETALMMAAYNGHASIVKSLIAAGADVNMASENGSTALDYANAKGFAAVQKLLKAEGASSLFTDNTAHNR